MAAIRGCVSSPAPAPALVSTPLYASNRPPCIGKAAVLEPKPLYRLSLSLSFSLSLRVSYPPEPHLRLLTTAAEDVAGADADTTDVKPAAVDGTDDAVVVVAAANDDDALLLTALFDTLLTTPLFFLLTTSPAVTFGINFIAFALTLTALSPALLPAISPTTSLTLALARSFALSPARSPAATDVSRRRRD